MATEHYETDEPFAQFFIWRNISARQQDRKLFHVYFISLFLIQALVLWLTISWLPSLICLLALGIFLLLMHHHYKYDKAHEIIEIHSQSLLLKHVNHKDEIQVEQFNPSWVRIEMTRDHHEDAQLYICEQDRSVRFGQYITSDEREILFRSINESLVKWRQNVVHRPA